MCGQLARARINTAKCIPANVTRAERVLPISAVSPGSESRVGCPLVETLVKRGHDRDLVLTRAKFLRTCLLRNYIYAYNCILNMKELHTYFK